MQSSLRGLNQQFGSLTLYSPALAEIVNSHPVTVTPHTGLGEVLAMMNTTQDGCVMVTQGLRLVGMFTAIAAARLVTQARNHSEEALQNLLQVPVGQVMSQPVDVLQVDDCQDVLSVISVIEQHQIQHLPVVDSDRNLLGIITPSSVRAVLNHGLDTVAHSNRTVQLERLLHLQQQQLQQQAQRERLLSVTAQRIHTSVDLQEILDTTVTEVREVLGCDRVLIYQFHPDWNGKITSESVTTYLSIVGQEIRDTYFAQTQGKEYLQSRKQLVSNVHQAGLNACHLALLEKLQVQAILTVPIIVNQQLWGLLGVHQCSQPRQWQPSEVDLLEQLSVHIAIAIQQTKANEQLELRVQQRTEQLQTEIAERQKAEAALQEANRTLNNILESITEGYFALDKNWNFTHFNKLLEPVLQRPVAELVGKNYFTEFPEAIGTPFEKAYRQAIEEQKLVSFEEYYPPLNIWFEVRVYPSADGASVYFRDISDRKRAETALRESEEKFRIALQNSPIVVFYQDTQLRYTWIYNPALGYQPDQVIGKDDSEIFALPEDAEKLTAFKREVLRTGTGARQEFILNSSGEMECYDLSVEPLRNPNGDIIGVSCVALDITPRKKAQQALEQSQRFIQRIADSNPNILYIYDLVEQRNIYTNREIANILGYTPTEVQQMGDRMVPELVHPDDFPRITNHHQRFATAKDGEVIETEYRMKRANGQWCWLYSWDTIFSRSPNGTPKQILGTASDITVLKTAQEQLRQNNDILAATNAELARATRMKDEFLANMSHELRTPLNAILGMSEGLLDNFCGTLTPQQRKAISTIEKSGKHLLSLINDILDLAKVESGNLELQITPVPITRLVDSSLTFIKQQAHKKNIQLTSQIPKNLGEIEVDERRMQQVLINLLSNAIKFTDAGGSVSITVEAHPEEPLISFSVSDTGIGIAPEHLSKLFKSFVQIDSSLSRCYEGTGLGLALVRRLVELHAGSVSLESEVGKGSRFTVTLPRCSDKQILSKISQDDIAAPAASPISPAAPDIVSHPEAPLILLAEDNEANIETISTYLLAAGYRLVIATNGWEAVLMAKQHQPAAIVMDIQMPEMDGLTATHQLRANSDTASIPIIALTALAMPGDREKCLAAGVSEYMKKPVSLKQLVKTIQNFIHG